MKPLFIILFICIHFQFLLFAEITVEYMEGDAYILNEKSERIAVSLGDTLGDSSVLYIEEHSLIELNCNNNRVVIDEQGYYPASLFLGSRTFQEKQKVLGEISSRISKLFHSDTDSHYRYDSVGGVRGEETEEILLTWEDENELLLYAEGAIQEEDWNSALLCLEEYKNSAEEIKSQYHILLAYIYIQKNVFQYAVATLEEAEIQEEDEYYDLYQEMLSTLTE